MLLPTLLAASYIINKDEDMRDSVLHGVGHGTSGFRTNMLRAAGFIAPLVSFSNRNLQDATMRNLRNRHMYYQESSVLYLCTNGSDNAKRRWALQMKDKFYEYEDQKAFFNRILTNPWIYQTPLFTGCFSEAKSYFLYKILADPQLSSHQPAMFEEEGRRHVLVEKLMDREDSHPLSYSCIKLSCIKERKEGLFNRG